MTNKEIFLHLSLIDGVASSTIAMMMQNKPDALDLADIYCMSATDLMRVFGLSPAAAQTIIAGLSDTKLLANELVLIEKYHIQWATIACPEYPKRLKNIHLLPPVIYWQGEKPDIAKSVAIVGSRKANLYGEQVINALVPPLVEYGYAIISGGALGADAMAHRATIQAGGKTVVVLGSGLLRPLPHSNKRLFEEVISHGGTMLSTFPLQTEAFAYNFPARNRIIAGLSQGTIVIQAAAQSGTSITAQFALEQGRDVFAVPGAINDELSVGCHALIAQGAKITTSAFDVLKEFGHEIDEPEKKTVKSKRSNDKAAQANIDQLVPRVQPDVDATTPIGIVMNLCSKPSSTDDLAIATGLDMGSLHALLCDMQLEGRINQNFTGMWHVG